MMYYLLVSLLLTMYGIQLQAAQQARHQQTITRQHKQAAALQQVAMNKVAFDARLKKQNKNSYCARRRMRYARAGYDVNKVEETLDAYIKKFKLNHLIKGYNDFVVTRR